MAVTPLRKIRKVKKRSKRFTRHECEDFPHKLRKSWRRPRGIDSRVRRQFRGNKPLVRVGYGTQKSHRHVLPNGFKKFLISNDADLEVLLMNNRVFCGELAHSLNKETRRRLVQRAAELNVRLTNSKARLVTEENNQE